MRNVAAELPALLFWRPARRMPLTVSTHKAARSKSPSPPAS